MAVIAQPTFIGAQTGWGTVVTSTGNITVPGRTTANFWLAVCGTNRSFTTNAGWTTVRNGGTYGKLYVAYTRSDPGETVSFGGTSSGTYTCLLTAWKDVADPPFYYESIYNSTAYGTSHDHPGMTPTGDSGYVGVIGAMHENYQRTSNYHGLLNMTMLGTNVKTVIPTVVGHGLSTHYAVKAILDDTRTHTYRSNWTSNTRGVMWMGMLQYGTSGPAFERDGVDGANIDNVDNVDASSIDDVDGVSA